MTCKLQSNDTLSSYPFSQFQLCVIMPRIYNSLFKNKVIIITIVLCMISSYRQLDLRTHHRTSSRVTTLKPPWLSQPRFVGSAAASASWNDWTQGTNSKMERWLHLKKLELEPIDHLVARLSSLLHTGVNCLWNAKSLKFCWFGNTELLWIRRGAIILPISQLSNNRIIIRNVLGKCRILHLNSKQCAVVIWCNDRNKRRAICKKKIIKLKC